MNRSEFLHTTALGTWGFSTLPLLKSQVSLPFENLKISLTPWSLMRTGYGGDDPLGIDVFDYPSIAKSLGFNFIDHEMFHFPPDLDDEKIERMVTNCQKAGVKNAVLLTGGVGDIGHPDKTKREKALTTYKYWVDVAQKLGCSAMRNVCASYITIPYEEKLKYTIEGVKELGNYVGEKGLDLLIENHNGYSSDPEWMIALMESVKLDNIGVLGDFTNWTLRNNPETYYPDPYRGIELLSPYIRAISAKSDIFNAQGEETTIDYKKMFEILQKATKLKFAGVEFFGTSISRHEGAQKTKSLIERSIEALQE